MRVLMEMLRRYYEEAIAGLCIVGDENEKRDGKKPGWHEQRDDSVTA
jgi:hypothetical protein